MTAKEIFEKLGYKAQYDDKYINWIKKVDGITCEITFDFNTELVEFYFYGKDFKDRYDVDLNISELQAINKQVEELRW